MWCQPGQAGVDTAQIQRIVGSDSTLQNVAWRPPEEVKGDLAREAMYMALRYNGSYGTVLAHAIIHSYTYIHTHTHTYTYTHIHTHTLLCKATLTSYKLPYVAYIGEDLDCKSKQILLSECPCVKSHKFGNLTTLLRW